MARKSCTFNELIETDISTNCKVQIIEGTFISEEGREIDQGSTIKILSIGVKFYVSPDEVISNKTKASSSVVKVFFINQNEVLYFKHLKDSGDFYMVTKDVFCIGTDEKIHKLHEKHIIRLLPMDDSENFFIQTNDKLLCFPKRTFDSYFKKIKNVTPRQLLEGKPPIGEVYFQNKRHHSLFAEMTGWPYIPVTDSMKLAICLQVDTTYEEPGIIHDSLSFISSAICMDITVKDMEDIKLQVEEENGGALIPHFSIATGHDVDGFQLYNTVCCNSNIQHDIELQFEDLKKPCGPTFITSQGVTIFSHSQAKSTKVYQEGQEKQNSGSMKHENDNLSSCSTDDDLETPDYENGIEIYIKEHVKNGQKTEKQQEKECCVQPQNEKEIRSFKNIEITENENDTDKNKFQSTDKKESGHENSNLYIDMHVPLKSEDKELSMDLSIEKRERDLLSQKDTDNLYDDAQISQEIEDDSSSGPESLGGQEDNKQHDSNVETPQVPERMERNVPKSDIHENYDTYENNKEEPKEIVCLYTNFSIEAKIQDLSVSDLCKFLRFYKQEKLADVCEAYMIDGQCIYEMEDSLLMEDPINLTKFELVRFQRLKDGKFPKIT